MTNAVQRGHAAPAKVSTAWETVREAIDAEDAGAVAALVAGLDDAGRRAVARELPGHLPLARRLGEKKDAVRAAARELRRQEWLAEQERKTSPADWSSYYAHHARYLWDQQESRSDRLDQRWIEPMRVAGAGTIAGAAGVVSWLYRRDLQRWQQTEGAGDVPLILQAIATRPAQWRADLAVRLALRLRGLRPEVDRAIELTLALLRETGAEPPAHDPLTAAWIAATSPGPDLANDPLLDAMLPRLFEAEGAGRALRADHPWPEALHALTNTPVLSDVRAQAGRVERPVLLDGCLRRFLRGGSAADLRVFVRLHDLLDPAAEEVAIRRRDYLCLLPAAPANVAELALRQVRRLDPLGAEDAAEVVEGLLFRAEAKLVRAGLSRLDQLVGDNKGDNKGDRKGGLGGERDDGLDRFAPALAVAFVSGSAEVRERAVRLVVKHASRLTPKGAETLREAMVLLPAEEAVRLGEIFGGEPLPVTTADPAAGFTPRPLDPAPEPRRLEPHTPSLTWLAHPDLSERGRLRAECWLDGFVRQVTLDRAGLTAACARVADRAAADLEWESTWELKTWVAKMATELTNPGARKTAVREEAPRAGDGPIGRIIPLRRFAEVCHALADGTLPPYLLATPTHDNGRLDAEQLLDRLEGYEGAGVEALPVDLEQALLRLPRAVPGEVVVRAARLTGQSGRRAFRWLSEPPAESRVTLRWETDVNGSLCVKREIIAEPTGLAILDDVIGQRSHRGESCRALLAVVPSYRELAAAHAVYSLLNHTLDTRPSIRDLAALTRADGPCGESVALILARFLLGGNAEGALPALAASGGLPGQEVGRQLALLARHYGESLSATLAALEEAAGQGAHREVWQVMAGLLPGALPGPGERATSAHTRLVAFAADAAGWAQARGELPEVAELAARRRVSALVRQARRLHAQLAGG